MDQNLHLYRTPIFVTIERLWDAGRDLYAFGFSPDERRVLIVDVDNEQVSIAHVDTANGLGRWECSKDHFWSNMGLYAERFPVR